MSMSSSAKLLNAQRPSSNTSTLVPPAGGERLDAGDPGNDLPLEIHGSQRRHLIDDPKRAVVERWVSPHEKRATLPVRQLLSNRVDVQGGALFMPYRDRGPVLGGVAIPLRVLNLDDPVRFCLHVALANLFPGTQQIRGVFALVGYEDHVHLTERVDGLNRDVVGIAGADTDELQPSHAELSPGDAAPAAGDAVPGGPAAAAYCADASSNCRRTSTMSPTTTRAGA